MYLKRLLAFLCCFTLVFCLFPSSAFATGGNGNIDGGGGSMGHGTSSNFWNSGNDGVRITVVDASSGTAVSSPLDFSNRTQKTSLLHFGKVNKLQYLGGAGLSLQSGVAYSCIRPTQSMPTIVSSKGQSNIEAIKRYFCSEYACMMVAQAAGVDYERMIAGEYKLLIEPIAYFTHNGQYYCMTATEAGLYDQMSGGNLRKTMTSLTHKNLPLSMFLEFSDLGISAWTGSTTGKQNNSDIISTLGVGIVWFDEAPPEGEIEAPDVEYRVDTDVITAVTLRTDQDLTPDNPASVTFHILGTTYRVNDIVIPAGDSQVVWVKWHTPSTPQTVTITVSVSGAYTAQDTFVAKIVDLNEHIPPDPVATDTNPGYSVPPLPSETQKLTANWGVWSCYWVPVWVWCDHGEDGGHWVDEGYWEYEYTGYSASISGEMSLMPDDIVPTASGKTMKSGYGVKTEVRATLSTDAPTSHITYPQTAFSVFPEFQYQTYLRLLQRSGGQSAKFIFKPNEFSTYDRTVHFTPLWFPDATDYTIYTQVWDKRHRQRQQRTRQLHAEGIQTRNFEIPDLGSTSSDDLLVRHTNHRILAYLRSAYPQATFEWCEKQPEQLIRNGGTGRIRVFGIDEFDHADVTLDQNANIKCDMVKIVPLSKVGGETSEDDATPPNRQPVDPRIWYETQGRSVLEALISDLNSRGHSKLTLRENGDICIEQGEDAVSQEHLNNFPQKVYWPRLAEVLESNGLAAEVTAQGIQVSW